MTEKMMKLWMHLILFPAFISAYANPVDCDFEEDSCSWSIEGFRRISDNQLNSTDGRNDIMHRNEVNYAVKKFNSTMTQSVLTSGSDIYPGEKCLSFKYQMKDCESESIFIDVHSYHNNSWSQVWRSQSQRQLHVWNEIGVTINVGNKSKIAIRFAHNNCSSVTYYISSISFKKQSCTESATPIKASTCTENPMNSQKDTITQKITTNYRITTIVKLSSTDIATSTAAGTVNISSYYPYAVVPVLVAVVVMVVLVAVCYCRRKKQSNSGTNVSMNNTGVYENLNVVFSQDNYDQIIRVTSRRDNTIMDRVYNNEEPEYLQIVE